jgi:hypothetical protein
MALDFPNPSRSYDATLQAVRFWGHDGAMEGLLCAFDRHRHLIHAAAAKVYRRGRKALYELVLDDF